MNTRAVLSILFAVLAVALAQPTIKKYQYAGITNSSSVGLPMVIDSSTGACSSGADTTEFRVFTIDTLAHAYLIEAMFSNEIVSGNAYVAIYTGENGYDVENPCTNVAAFGFAQKGTAPHVNFPIVLAEGKYQVVIQTTSDVNGKFAVHATPVGHLNTHTDVKGYWYYPSTSSTGSETCYESSYVSPYSYWSAQVPESGWYDIDVYFKNTTATSTELVIALYNETLPTWANTSSFGSPADPCVNASYINSYRTVSRIPISDNQGLEASAFGRVWLSNETWYHLFVSNEYAETTGDFFVNIHKTIFTTLGPDQNYDRPSTTLDPESCSPNGGSYNWKAIVLNPENPTYLVDAGWMYNYVDLVGAVYRGNNSGTEETPHPETCTDGFIACVDIGDIAPMAVSGLEVGDIHTFVITTYSGSNYANQEVSVVLMTGQYLGPTPPVAPVTTEPSEAPNAASAVHASIALALLAVFAMLF